MRSRQRHNPEIDMITSPVPRLYLSHGVLNLGHPAPGGRWQCPQTRQVLMTGQVCTPWASAGKGRARAAPPGSRTRADRAGLWPARGGWVRAEPLRMGGHPAHTAPRTPRPHAALAPGPVHLELGRRVDVRGGCPSTAGNTGRQGRQPRGEPWPSCLAPGLVCPPCGGRGGGARQAARDTCPSGSSRAARAKGTRGRGCQAPRGHGSRWTTRIRQAARWPGPARGGSRRRWPAFFGAALLRLGSPSARQRPHPRAPFPPRSSVGVRCVSAFLSFEVTRCDRGSVCRRCVCVGGASSLGVGADCSLPAAGSGCHCPLAGLPA